MKLSFRLDSKNDILTPIITIINEYDKNYIIIDYNIYKLGILDIKWIDISIELVRKSAVKLHEYRDRIHAPIDVVRAIQKEIADFDNPATWEESNENTNKIN